RPEKLDDVRAVHEAAKLPIMLASGKVLPQAELVACGVRFLSRGTQPVLATVRALTQTYTHLFNGGAPADLKSSIASDAEMEQLVQSERYQQDLHEYMR